MNSKQVSFSFIVLFTLVNFGISYGSSNDHEPLDCTLKLSDLVATSPLPPILRLRDLAPILKLTICNSSILHTDGKYIRLTMGDDYGRRTTSEKITQQIPEQGRCDSFLVPHFWLQVDVRVKKR